MPETGKVQHPIAFCNIHGVFPATALTLGNGAGITVVNCRINCPVCGASSEIIPGHYQARADQLNLLIDPSVSPSAVAALRSLAMAASTGKITAEQARAEAEKIHPKAGKLFDVQNWSDQAKATLYAAIIAAGGAITAARIATNS